MSSLQKKQRRARGRSPGSPAELQLKGPDLGEGCEKHDEAGKDLKDLLSVRVRALIVSRRTKPILDQGNSPSFRFTRADLWFPPKSSRR